MNYPKSGMKQGLLAVLLIMALGWSSCESSPPDYSDLIPDVAQLTIRFELVSEGQSYAVNESFLDAQGNRVNPLLLKFYLSDILLSSGNATTELSEIDLIDFKPFDPTISGPQWTTELVYTIDPGTYSNLSFGLGMKPSLNGTDPATYPNSHPLGTYTNMHWTWASMYRFVILEAGMETNGGTAFEHDLVFHTGTDPLYRPDMNYPLSLDLSTGEEAVLTFTIDWNDLFYNSNTPIDVESEFNTHTTDSPQDYELAERFTDNLVEAIALKP